MNPFQRFPAPTCAEIKIIIHIFRQTRHLPRGLNINFAAYRFDMQNIDNTLKEIIDLQIIDEEKKEIEKLVLTLQHQ